MKEIQHIYALSLNLKFNVQLCLVYVLDFSFPFINHPLNIKHDPFQRYRLELGFFLLFFFFFLNHKPSKCEANLYQISCNLIHLMVVKIPFVCNCKTNIDKNV